VSEAGPILDYDTPQHPPVRTLTLEEGNQRVRVIFAVFPTWVYLLPILIGSATGLLELVKAILTIRMILRLLHGAGQPTLMMIDTVPAFFLRARGRAIERDMA